MAKSAVCPLLVAEVGPCQSILCVRVGFLEFAVASLGNGLVQVIAFETAILERRNRIFHSRVLATFPAVDWLRRPRDLYFFRVHGWNLVSSPVLRPTHFVTLFAKELAMRLVGDWRPLEALPQLSKLEREECAVDAQHLGESTIGRQKRKQSRLFVKLQGSLQARYP